MMRRLFILLILAQCGCAHALSPSAGDEKRYDYHSYNYNAAFGGVKTVSLNITDSTYVGWHTIDEMSVCAPSTPEHCFKTPAFSFCVPKQFATPTGSNYSCRGNIYTVRAITVLRILGETIETFEITARFGKNPLITFYFSRTNGLLAIKFDGPEEIGEIYLSEQKRGFPY